MSNSILANLTVTASTTAEAEESASPSLTQPDIIDDSRDDDSIIAQAPTNFDRFSELPTEIQCMIWSRTWRPRTVTIRRYISRHHSDPKTKRIKDDSTRKNLNKPAKVKGHPRKMASRKRHHDKCLHSNAVMSRTWDGTPSAAALARDPDAAGLKYKPQGQFRPTLPAPPAAHPPRQGEGEGEGLRLRLPLSHNQRKMQLRTPNALGFDVTRVATVAWAEASLPVSLWVDQLSRSWTRKHYHIAFGLVGGESHVYFNFAKDTLNVPRHVQLWRAFGKEDLSRLRYLRVPESARDVSGDMRAVGRLTDKLYTTGAGGETMLDDSPMDELKRYLPGRSADQSVGAKIAAMDEGEQMAYVLTKSREAMGMVLPSLRVLHLAPTSSCVVVDPDKGPRACLVSHGKVTDAAFVIDRCVPGLGPHRNRWESHLEFGDDAPPMQVAPLMSRPKLDQQDHAHRAVSLRSGAVAIRGFRVREGCEVRMPAVELHAADTLPPLGNYASKLRVFHWGRWVTQVTSVDKNLRFLLELGDEGERKSATMDYEL